ncbi:hypothetical protein ACG7TL_007362 [Trametes sanguinea]
MMKNRRIGVLMLQETHLTADRKSDVMSMFKGRIKIFHSQHPDSPTRKEGVAIVLNKSQVPTEDAACIEIVPGRAIQVSLKVHGNEQVHLLCVYAPTSDGVEVRRSFYAKVREFYETHPNIARPTLMAGDFNNVEDSLDRLPVSEPDASLAELDSLKLALGLMIADGWRATNPVERCYTFHRGTGGEATCARLDRIYISEESFSRAREWQIRPPAIKTDHSLVSVQLSMASAPTVGKGRPTFALHIIKDKLLAKKMKEVGLAAQHELEMLEMTDGRTATRNAQTILYALKSSWLSMARDREKELVPKLIQEIRELNAERKKLQNDLNVEDGKRAKQVAKLTTKITDLEIKRTLQQQMKGKARHKIDGERPTKYWTKIHKPCAPREIIHAFEKEELRDSNGNRYYEVDSSKMAEMAREHHDSIQRDEAGIPLCDERERCIQIALASLENGLEAEESMKMAKDFTYEECELALHSAKSGTAPGRDGIPYEVWKTLQARFTEDSRHEGRAAFDVVKMLHRACVDIQTHGVAPSVPFADGWMAPIYKEKGERTQIVNYRPITLLNTDYKLLTKMLAIRLAAAAPSLINEAQAGFIPGRKLKNHTQLARLMTSWAELTETNGAIIALDQEKAYDKIAHDYLWRVLEGFGIPPNFIGIVQSLYKNAETAVLVNGVLSKPYLVTRGVRQGDPLSCLLFNLAIEPLSAMIRKSGIKGINIPNTREALKATLFADDTTAYLSENDDFATLQNVLDTWCAAAKARFNISKTEIIPIGNAAYREEMVDTYRRTGSWKNLPRNARIAADGEPVRILGAWMGNRLDECGVWSPKVDLIKSILERWTRSRPTLEGKRHVVQMFAGGMSQFLTTVQRMPKNVVNRLNTVIRNYLWNDRHTPPVRMEFMFLPVEMGGFQILDLEARNESIDIMWLKDYLNYRDRPLWAYIADDILAKVVPARCIPTETELRINPFLQNWKPTKNQLPLELKAIMLVGKKYGLRMEGRAFSRDILRSLPMWDHAQASKQKLRSLSSRSLATKCLKYKHKLVTVGDFESFAAERTDPGHQTRRRCECDRCTHLRMSVDCTEPDECYRRAVEFLNTLPSKWDPRGEHPEDYEEEEHAAAPVIYENIDEAVALFDRRVTRHGTIGDTFRIFTGPGNACN